MAVAMGGDLLWSSWATGEAEMQASYLAMIWGAPALALCLMVLWLRVLWPSPAPKLSAPPATPASGAIATTAPASVADDPATPTKQIKQESASVATPCRNNATTPPKTAKEKATAVPKTDMLKERLLEAGESVASEIVPYTDDWTTTFDFTFLIGYVLGVALLVVVSYLIRPDLLCEAEMFNLGVKFGVMMASSIVGGVLCRLFCVIDDRGYIAVDERGKTKAKVKGFKVNYTRKIQHFCAYAVPVFIKSPFAAETPMTLAWGNMATLLGFLVVIKPLRELHAFFMMQFNSFDRPEDRPFTLKWIVLGDIVPGMFGIMFFYALLGMYTVNGYQATSLCYIFLMVCGFGDGLAEPVGVTWGTHKYEKWFLFVNASAFWITMLVLPPLMAWAEARSPHTMDTPFLFAVGGLWLWAALYIPAIPGLEPVAA